MRLSGVIDDNEQYKTDHLTSANGYGGDPSTTGENAPQETPPSGAPPSAPPETPAETPGPNGNPQGGQGGPPPQTPPAAPPAVTGQTGQGQGLETSAATGGLAGSFAQVGDTNFAQRFGGQNPAVWFRNFGQQRQNEQANVGRGNVDKVGNAGGAIPSEGPMGGPSMGSEGGGKNDEEWQRFMQEVARLRFGRGGA
jgi:hypothetical protein